MGEEQQRAQLLAYQQQLQTVEMQIVQNPAKTEVTFFADPLLTLACPCILQLASARLEVSFAACYYSPPPCAHLLAL